MNNQEVPFIIEATGEVIGTAKITVTEDKKRAYANISIPPEKADLFDSFMKSKDKTGTVSISVEESNEK